MEELWYELILKYIVDKAFVLVPVLWFLGFVIKKIPKMPDWAIPFILLAIGIPAAMAIIGFTDLQTGVTAAGQGVLVVAAAVFGHQLKKQVQEAIATKKAIIVVKKEK